LVPASPLKVNSQKPEDTLHIGYLIGARLSAHTVLGLEGGLGAGKTTLVRGIARGWQVQDRVSSPTYTLVNIYRHATDPTQRLFHIDAYRLQDDAAAESVGLSDIFDAGGPVVIEWPAYINLWLPEDMLRITMSDQFTDPDRRVLTFISGGPAHNRLLTTLMPDLEELS
jgi:tRNA threonylcarbamoyladenosine biosynthesis protein TsaE